MADFAKTKEILELRLKELTHRAEEIEEELSEPGDDDWSEAATEAEDDEVLEKVGLMAEDEMRLIAVALSRIDDGSYGICAECQVKIPEKRLEAVPYATSCVSCSNENSKK